MLNIISAVILSVSANLDNLLIGMSYGANKIKIPLGYIIIIGIVVAFMTLIALLFGEYILFFIPERIAIMIGSGILIAMGIYSIVTLKNNENESKNKISKISLKSSIGLAFTLSLNNLIIAVAGSISGIKIVATIMFSFVFSVLFLFLGNVIGRKIDTKIVAIISSILLIILGILEVII